MITETERLTQIIKNNAPMSIKEIILDYVEKWLNSDEYMEMLTSQRYYNAKHDILNKTRKIINEYGELSRLSNVSNNKLVHPFYRDLVDQKIQYILGKPFSFKIQDNVRDENKKKFDELESFFDNDVRDVIRLIAKEAMIKGIGWIYFHYDSQGEICLDVIPSENLIPIWSDSRKRKLDGMIRILDIDYYQSKTKVIKTLIEYWSNEGKSIFEYRRDIAQPDRKLEVINYSSHDFTIDDQPQKWGRIPFVPVKYNDEEMPMLNYVKPLIDYIDTLMSDTADIVKDSPDSILVVKNYDGQDLGHFRRNLASYRTVKVSGDGGLEQLTIPVDTQAAQFLLESTRSDIFTHGRGVDTQKIVTSNVSEKTLRHAYTQMDLDASSLENQLNKSLKDLLFFVGQAIGEDFKNENIQIIFNKDILITEDAAIEMCLKNSGLLSKQTVLANNPWVDNVEKELEHIEQEKMRDDENQLNMMINSIGRAGNINGKNEDSSTR